MKNNRNIIKIIFLPIQYLFYVFILFYKIFISPILPSSCIFHPTCSQYAQDAVKKYNPVKALYFIIKRLLKCHPYYNGDKIDPVP